MIINVARLVVSLSLIISSISKLVWPESLVSIVSRHGIIPISLLPYAITLHVIIGLCLGVLIITKPGLNMDITYKITGVFVSASLLYLIAIIIKNGWTISCGCYAGIYETEQIYISLLHDVILVIIVMKIYARTDMISTQYNPPNQNIFLD
jgi:hypothetical protein